MGINNKAACFHVGVYLIYLIGLVYYYYAYIRNLGKDTTKHEYLVTCSIKQSLGTVSVVSFAYLLQNLCCDM